MQSLVPFWEKTKNRLPKVRLNQRINLLVGSHLTPVDVIELKDIITSYGFEVIAIPDLSTSIVWSFIRRLCNFTKSW
ncbi:hypothetical protein KHA80_07070 [Anaerobacillus sp. HL2]|nr:hypothetical protein KHA80_07070 [Anaerobacillus sp. HL2]